MRNDVAMNAGSETKDFRVLADELEETTSVDVGPGHDGGKHGPSHESQSRAIIILPMM